MFLSRLSSRNAERIINSLWTLNCPLAKRNSQFQPLIIRSMQVYPNYYGTPKVREKLKYTVDHAVELLREQTKSNPNCMVSMHVKMNLDYRIKSQRICGVFDMPHSTSKLRSVVAMTLDLDLAEAALNAGANHAGDVGPRILNNQIKFPSGFDMVIATPEMAHEVTGRSKLAKRLKRYKVLPCCEEYKTIVEPEEFCETVRKYAYGFINHYRNDDNGNVTTSIGRFSSKNSEIIDNFYYVLRHLFDTQLTQFGNGPDAKQKNIGKYILKLQVTASQGDAFDLDLDAIDILRELNQQSIPIKKGWRIKLRKN